MTASSKMPKPLLASVVDAKGRCLGFILRRRPGEVEGYTADERSIGTFASDAAALAAVANNHKAAPR
jgi:hypothetical protein